MNTKRLAQVIVGILVLTAVSGVVAAVLLGPPSTTIVNLREIDLTASGFPTKVSPGGVYYFNVTARSTYSTDMTRVFITVTLNGTCASLAGKLSFAEKSAIYGGYAPMTGVDTAGNSCTFTNVGITATVPTGQVPVVYWFRVTVTATLPDLTWSFRAARQN